jgi:hypothetical protein
MWPERRNDDAPTPHPIACEGREKEQYNGAEGGAEMRGERKR